MPRRSLPRLLRDEFAGYNAGKFRQDLLAGLTVAAVALRLKGIDTAGNCRHVQVAYLTGPLFFAATGTFNEAFAHLNDTHALILSVRGVPLLDTSGLQVLQALHERVRHQGGTLMLLGAHDQVQKMLGRGGLLDEIGEENIFWSADQAIVAAEGRVCRHCEAEKEG